MVNTGVEYTPGQLLAVVTPATVVVVDAPTDWSLAGPLWELALDDAPIDEILDCLVRRGIRTAPTFAVVRVEETAVRVLVRGPVRVGVERSGDPVRLDASGATTWLEAVVSTPRRVLVGNVEPAARSPYLVATGVVLAGGLVLPCIPQAAQRYEEEGRREIAPPPPPAVAPSPPQLMASAAPAPTPFAAPTPPAQAPSPDSAPAIVDLTRLESPTSQGIMAGRSAWMDPAPSPKTDGPKPSSDLGGPVRKAPEDDAPAAAASFRSPEPFRAPEPFRPSEAASFRSEPESFRSSEPASFRSEPEPKPFRSSEPSSFRSEPEPFRPPSPAPSPFRSPSPGAPASSPSEPAAFRSPGPRPVPPGATPPAPPSPLSPPSAGPGLAPPVSPTPLTPPSSLNAPSPLPRPLPPGSKPPAEPRPEESLRDEKDDLDEKDLDGPPPGPSPADLPSFDPPSMSVPLPPASRPAAVFAPPVERPDDEDEEDDGRDKVVASPSGLPVRVRGQSMPVDLRGALNGTYRDTATAARPEPERPQRTFDRPSFESSPFERPMFEAPAQVQDVTPDRSGFSRPPFDRAAEAEPDDVDEIDEDENDDDVVAESPRGNDSVIQLPRRPGAPADFERPRPPGSPAQDSDAPAPPSPIRPGLVPPGGGQPGGGQPDAPNGLNGPRPIPPAAPGQSAAAPTGADLPDLGAGAQPLPAFFRGTRVARGENGPATPAGVEDDADDLGGAPRVPGVLRSVGNDDSGADDGDGDALREPPRLLGVWCDAGHVTSPDRSECRVCGLTVPPQAPILVARPPLGELVFDNGERVSLDRPVILGRDPKPVQSADSEAPRLHPVHSATGQVSRTHAEVRASGWDVVVTDLDAMNGTTVTHPGGEPEPLEPGQVTVITAGTRIDLGGETGFVFEVDA